jgi:hypothetical protein
MSTTEGVVLGVILAVSLIIGLSLLIGRLSARPRQKHHRACNEESPGVKCPKHYVFAPVIVVGNRIER